MSILDSHRKLMRDNLSFRDRIVKAVQREMMRVELTGFIEPFGAPMQISISSILSPKDMVYSSMKFKKPRPFSKKTLKTLSPKMLKALGFFPDR
jgi:hypothetical protein